VKWYRVRPSYDGEQEYLYEIAERFLGDGDRLDEIFELNRGRLQADGNRLTVPDEIESGWVLRMPADAEGPGLETAPLPDAAPSAPASSAAPLRAGTTPQKSGLSPIMLIAGLLLVVAGAVLAVVVARRRRATPSAAGVVVPRRRTGGEAPAFDAAASWTIDRALRVLATSAAAGGPAGPADPARQRRRELDQPAARRGGPGSVRALAGAGGRHALGRRAARVAGPAGRPAPRRLVPAAGDAGCPGRYARVAGPGPGRGAGEPAG
jgi:hypothetical protein